MKRKYRFFTGRSLAAMAILALVIPLNGCGLLANVLWDGTFVEAEYKEPLKEKRVAVVCISGSSFYLPDNESSVLARKVGEFLEKKVEGIQIIPQQKIAAWIDSNDWDTADYQAIRKGLKADKVIAIELANFSTHSGPGVFKGTAKVNARIYDETTGSLGKQVLPNKTVSYPKMAEYTRQEFTEEEFTENFLKKLAFVVSRIFYRYDEHDKMTFDPTNIGQ